MPPPDPAEASSSLSNELERLRKELTEYRHQTIAEKAAFQQEAEACIKAAYAELDVALGLAHYLNVFFQSPKCREEMLDQTVVAVKTGHVTLNLRPRRH